MYKRRFQFNYHANKGFARTELKIGEFGKIRSIGTMVDYNSPTIVKHFPQKIIKWRGLSIYVYHCFVFGCYCGICDYFL